MAARKLDTKPRKKPHQKRAKATVDAILRAAAQVLVAKGYDGTTTARVAERAGVSIGSLYQYFPNKQALVAALIEQHANEMVEVVRTALDGTETLRHGLEKMIQAGTDAHRIDPALHKILSEQVPRVGKMAKAMDTSKRLRGLLEQFLNAHSDELHPDRDPALAAEVVEVAMEAVGHHAVLHRSGAIDALQRECYRMVVSYLTR